MTNEQVQELITALQKNARPGELNLIGWSQLHSGNGKDGCPYNPSVEGSWLLILEWRLNIIHVRIQTSPDFPEVRIYPGISLEQTAYAEAVCEYCRNFLPFVQELYPDCFFGFDYFRISLHMLPANDTDSMMRKLQRVIFMFECIRDDLCRVSAAGESRGQSFIEELSDWLTVLSCDGSCEPDYPEQIARLLLADQPEDSCWNQPISA